MYQSRGLLKEDGSIFFVLSRFKIETVHGSTKRLWYLSICLCIYLSIYLCFCLLCSLLIPNPSSEQPAMLPTSPVTLKQQEELVFDSIQNCASPHHHISLSLSSHRLHLVVVLVLYSSTVCSLWSVVLGHGSLVFGL
jgi:hypothetical protein